MMFKVQKSKLSGIILDEKTKFCDNLYYGLFTELPLPNDRHYFKTMHQLMSSENVDTFVRTQL